jgi:hypothetical protein
MERRTGINRPLAYKKRRRRRKLNKQIKSSKGIQFNKAN